MSEHSGAFGSPIFVLRILALILAALSLYNIIGPEKVAVGISGLGVAALSGIILPVALKQTEDHD